MTTSLFPAVMGTAFDTLAPAVQRFHRLAGRHELQGWVDTDAPASPLARWLAWLLRTPAGAGSGPLRFTLDAQPHSEHWARCFPGRTLRSRLSAADAGLAERLGPLRFGFALHAREGSLVMQLRSLHLLGLPCPAWLMPSLLAEESGHADTLHFVVRAALPGVGVVAGYRGRLVLPPEQAP